MHDELMKALGEAWARVRPMLLRDPDELAARLARRRRPVLQRPLRNWCLAIRSADTRITPMDALIVPEYAPARLVAHDLTVDSRLLWHLCRPVHLTPPGEPLNDVCRKLGVHPNCLHYARFKGVFQTHYVPPTAGRGPDLPLLYAPRPLDPSTHLFARPGIYWPMGQEWLYHHLPKHFEQTVRRVPAFHDRGRRPPAPHDPSPPKPGKALPPPPPDYVWYKWKGDQYIGTPDDQRRATNRARSAEYRRNHPKPSRDSGSLKFRGWRWECPSCKKTARTLYYPLPPMTHPQLQIANRKSLVSGQNSNNDNWLSS